MPLEIFQMILGITISVATVITISAAGVRWLVRHYFDDIKKELKPNSGSSMKDQVTRLEKDILDLKVLETSQAVVAASSLRVESIHAFSRWLGRLIL